MRDRTDQMIADYVARPARNAIILQAEAEGPEFRDKAFGELAA
ncbi:MAG: hypothetical protein P8Y58_07405 [Novosphingobium sp.]|jgi:hypothetical protein